MIVKMKPTSVIKENLGIQKGGPVHAFFTAECARYMDRFVPFDTGTLAETVIQGGEPTRNVKSTTITYAQPYARYVYYGISKSGKRLNYQKDKHEDATSYWDKYMWTAYKDDILKSDQKKVGGKK